MLLVIGDLHAVIWGGRLIVREADSRSLFPNISIRYLGAPLGYNLIAETEAGFVPGKWGIEVLKHVRETPDVTAICLSFGEIDVRTRAVKVALDTGRPLKDLVADIGNRLAAFCDLLRKETAHPIFVAAPVPTTHGDSGIRTIRPTDRRENETRRHACSWTTSRRRARKRDRFTSFPSSINSSI